MIVSLFFVYGISLANETEDWATAVQFSQGQNAFFSGDLISAREILLPLAEAGHTESNYYLALVYQSMELNLENESRALFYLNQAAKDSHAGAMWALGSSYDNGSGVDKNSLMAMDWYRKSKKIKPPDIFNDIKFIAKDTNISQSMTGVELISNLKMLAAQGDVDAQIKLAELYDYGVIQPVNQQGAFNWYQAAAQQNNKHAQFMLGYFYCRGIGTDVEVTAANHWLEQSGRTAHCEE